MFICGGVRVYMPRSGRQSHIIFHMHLKYRTRMLTRSLLIALTAQVDLAAVTVDEKFTDAYFARPAVARRDKSEARFMAKVFKSFGLAVL